MDPSLRDGCHCLADYGGHGVAEVPFQDGSCGIRSVVDQHHVELVPQLPSICEGSAVEVVHEFP
eukprot:6932550-Heterocapsa_arctica.AAC.1